MHVLPFYGSQLFSIQPHTCLISAGAKSKLKEILGITITIRQLGHWELPLIPGHYFVFPAVLRHIALGCSHMLFNRAGPVGGKLVFMAKVPAFLQAFIVGINSKAPFAV